MIGRIASCFNSKKVTQNAMPASSHHQSNKLQAEPLRIAYLTSHYARASDSFIRGEVAQLRRLGCEVFTFSIRRPADCELVSDEIRRERRQTEDILAQPLWVLVWSLLATALQSPLRLLSTLELAWQCSPPGIKGRLLAFAYTWEAAHLARRLRSLRIQHLHNHIGEGSATVAMLAGRLAEVPFSLTVHGPNEFDRPQIIALQRKIEECAFVVGISSFGRSQLCRWSRYEDWHKIKVVHCGVDESFLDHPATPITAAPRLVSIGRLAEQKGQLLLVEAAAQLAEEGLEFEIVLVGDGPMRGELERLIEQRGLQHHVRLAGWKGAADVHEEILQSRALVMPSFAEGLPVVCMESLALRRPVISTCIAGIPELVVPGVTGWLVPAGRIDELVVAMRAALTMGSDELEILGEAGAVRVRRDHNSLTEARKLAKLMGAFVDGDSEAGCVTLNNDEPARRTNVDAGSIRNEELRPALATPNM